VVYETSNARLDKDDLYHLHMRFDTSVRLNIYFLVLLGQLLPGPSALQEASKS
jgi:hypothetical protein